MLFRSVDRLGSGDHLVGRGRGEDLAGAGGIKHAMADEARMQHFANKAINEGLSVRSLEEAVALDKPTPGKAKIVAGGRQDALKEIADRLGDKFDTKVSISLGKKKGQIVIDFATFGDLQRIVKMLD